MPMSRTMLRLRQIKAFMRNFSPVLDQRSAQVIVNQLPPVVL